MMPSSTGRALLCIWAGSNLQSPAANQLANLQLMLADGVELHDSIIADFHESLVAFVVGFGRLHKESYGRSACGQLCDAVWMQVSHGHAADRIQQSV